MTDARLAAALAEEAGALLLDLQRRGAAGTELGDRGDAEANTLILDRLRTARPDDRVLSEETPDDPRRCVARRVWIVDPLDGTRDYAAHGADWAVHVGLAIDGRPAVGAVAIPARGLVRASDAVRRRGACQTPPRMVVSRSRAAELVHQVRASLGASATGMGSAGVKAMAVVDGDADIYLHDGGQYEWDNCAPAAVALAAGLHASRIDGSPLRYNRADPLLPDLLICRPEIAEATLAAIAAARG